MNNMYKDTVTWNPFKGCLFDCIYCKPSFQAQAKRQKQRCTKCYRYVPHMHPERLKQRLPKDKLIFVCGSGDISFASFDERVKIFEVIKNNPDKTFLVQTKSPMSFLNYKMPSNIIFGTTIETNRDISKYSKAPSTEDRYLSLKDLKHPRKFITHEPLINFDIDVLLDWDKQINPEIVWVGYANHINGLYLDEPELNKTKKLIKELNSFTDVRLKTMRNKI